MSWVSNEMSAISGIRTFWEVLPKTSRHTDAAYVGFVFDQGSLCQFRHAILTRRECVLRASQKHPSGRITIKVLALIVLFMAISRSLGHSVWSVMGARCSQSGLAVLAQYSLLRNLRHAGGLPQPIGIESHTSRCARRGLLGLFVFVRVTSRQ